MGAMPGRILQSIKNAGVTNPVMVLDEVDKLMAGGYSGDPASALLEVLDPEQNSTFTDHYLDLPYDLSDVFFIATANSTETIPGPLMDRMEVIQVTGYTEEEKFHIAKEHLIPEVREEHGLTAEQFRLEDGAVRKIISDYTLEAGVRGLKKQLAAVARSLSEKIVMRQAEELPPVRAEDLEELLGRQVSRHDKAQEDNPPGVVTGLAWTPVGGEILFIEATDMPGNGQVILTGQLGDVMKESARISLSLLKSRLPPGYGQSERQGHPYPCALRGGGQGRAFCGHRAVYGSCVAVYGKKGGSASGHDGRDHPARRGTAHRRPEGKAAGRPPGRHYKGADPCGQ